MTRHAAGILVQSGVNDFGLGNLLLHVRVATQAEVAPRAFGENDLFFPRVRVAGVTGFVRKRWVREIVDQLGAF
jgi:hypothetical protein